MSTSRARGQMAMEFIIMTAFAIMIGVAYLALAYDALSVSIEQERIIAMNDLGYTLQDELILASSVQDGYSRTFTISDRVNRFTYQMNSFQGGVTLTSGPTTITYSLPDASGTFVIGTNTITKKGEIEIT